MSQSIKELLKPPFKFNGKKIMDQHFILLDVLAFAEFTNPIGNFIVSALNEKYERDFGDPIRWIPVEGTDDWKCPECEKEFYFNGHSPDAVGCKCCLNCGQKLEAPEGE